MKHWHWAQNDPGDYRRNIQEHIWTTYSRQKRYVDNRRQPLEFAVGDGILLKVSPTKGIRRFGVRAKLSRRYNGPYKIIERLSLVASQLDLLVDLEHVHNVFHISQLKKYISDPDHSIIIKPIEVTEDLVYEERPVQY